MTVRAVDADEILIPAERIAQRVGELAAEISRDYAGRELVLVGVLKGSVIFFSDLIRRLSIPCTTDFISVSSYDGAVSSGIVKLELDLEDDPAGKHLLIVEDIVDSGVTLSWLQEYFRTRHPASVRACVLLDKREARTVPVAVDYRGFTVPAAFVVGYGMDYREHYRGLPYIGILHQKG